MMCSPTETQTFAFYVSPALRLRDMKSIGLEIRLDGGRPSLIYHLCLTTRLVRFTSYCSLRVGVSTKQLLNIRD